MLPRPCLSFTLPSVYDDTKLDCRVYHPPCLRSPSRSGAPWPGHAAVVAHPYAPLGGCFDDPIVDIAAGTLLQLGFLVATFNFRGAASSEGRTSWTSKPEQADYVSIVGFLAYYVHHLDPPPPPAAPPENGNQRPVMLFAGYSYGAMVAARLPPLETILAYFATPATHTAEADIRLRALHLAEARNALAAAGPASPRKALGVRVGGDEDGATPPRRRSHDGHDFLREDRIRESVRHLLARAKLVYRRSPHWAAARQPGRGVDACLEGVGDMAFRSAYLLVSPPVGVVTRLATMSFAGLLPAAWMGRGVREGGGAALLAANPTLLVYGGLDGFITHRKMREWTGLLAGGEASRFRVLEVAGAGHFWMEGDVIYQLRDAIGTFATELISLGGTPGPSLQMSQDLQ
ncbi:Alpha/Beta hydrolase protein [Nemania diffusa]|nr:Alpha/Beta hydrolase protein [Nemania diffusa]